MASLVVMATVHEKESTAISLNIGSQFLIKFYFKHLYRNCTKRARMSMLHVKIAIASRLAIAISTLNGYYQLTGNSDFNVKSLLPVDWH